MRNLVILLLLATLGFSCSSATAPTEQTQEATSAEPTQTDGSANFDRAMETPPPEGETIREDVPDSPPVALPTLQSPRTIEPGEKNSAIRIQPSLAFGKDGKIGVAWTGINAKKELIIFFSVIDSEGKTSPPVQLDTTPGGTKNEPSVCARSGGGFVVAWSVDTKKSDSVNGNLQVHFRLLSADGKPETKESNKVVTDVVGNHWLAEVACTPEGGFAFVGVRKDADNKTFGVFLQRFDAKGTAQSKATYVNPEPAGTQVHPVVGAAKTGAVVVGYDDSLNKQESVKFRIYPKPGAAPKSLATVATNAKGVNLAMNSDTGAFAFSAILNNGSGVTVKRYDETGSNPEALTLPNAGPLTLQVALTTLAPDPGYGVIYLTRSGGTSTIHLSLVGTQDGQNRTIQLSQGNLPPYRPAVAYQGGKLAAAWTERTPDKGFKVKVALFP